MTARGTQLSATADRQISDLIELLSTRGEATLSLPCPGREKLGDGSIAAVARHTADTYHRIADFTHGRGDGAPMVKPDTTFPIGRRTSSSRTYSTSSALHDAPCACSPS